MKLQFGDGRLRVRVGRAELERLLAGERLAVGMDWPGTPWRLEIGTARTFRLDATAGVVRIELPTDDLRALADRLPAREGLRFAFDLPGGAHEVRFEVDLHDGRGRSR